jgi:hypothetical protein|tara:strand:- start:275 stop:1123 length:849 start_codon:yes stop_codon:yes gene_type:complete
MGFIDNTKKALRLLLGRRFTSDDLSMQQEAFTSTLDISSADVYTEDHLVPSSNIPFSGSSQNGNTEASAIKYWFRQRMTKSNLDTDVWFFLTPTGSDSGVTPQIINANQKTDFISSKYSTPELTNAGTEDVTPGYNVVVYKSTSTSSGSFVGSDKVSINDYQFDYKTGVLQFDQNKPTSNQKVYITVYQYIGKTLATDPNIGIFTQTGSFYSTENNLKVTGSFDISLDGIDDKFTVSSGGNLKFEFNEEGTVKFTPQATAPTAVSGGMFYSGSDDYFLGFDN